VRICNANNTLRITSASGPGEKKGNIGEIVAQTNEAGERTTTGKITIQLLSTMGDKERRDESLSVTKKTYGKESPLKRKNEGRLRREGGRRNNTRKPEHWGDAYRQKQGKLSAATRKRPRLGNDKKITKRGKGGGITLCHANDSRQPRDKREKSIIPQKNEKPAVRKKKSLKEGRRGVHNRSSQEGVLDGNR